VFESIFAETPGDIPFNLPQLAASLFTSLVIGLLNSFVYAKTHGIKTPSQSFMLTLVLLPAVITVIILLVGNNVARAFSLAGAFSIIRFRSVPGDPKDIAYVLFSMAVGLAAGMGFIAYAAIVGVALCGVMVLLTLSGYGRPKGENKLLKITVPENLDFTSAFDDILREYTASYTRRRIKTAELGSLYELQYDVTVKKGANEKSFIDELRCRNGNLNIALLEGELRIEN
jgi:hypothetical protein